jgi:hypothetical protein
MNRQKINQCRIIAHIVHILQNRVNKEVIKDSKMTVTEIIIVIMADIKDVMITVTNAETMEDITVITVRADTTEITGKADITETTVGADIIRTVVREVSEIIMLQEGADHNSDVLNRIKDRINNQDHYLCLRSS